MKLELIPKTPNTKIHIDKCVWSIGKSEDQIQAECVKRFNNTFCLKIKQPRSIILSIPNGGTRHRIEAITLKSTGLYPGAADLIIVHNGYTFFTEMKKLGASQSPDQKNFEKHINSINNQFVKYLLFDSLYNFCYFFDIP